MSLSGVDLAVVVPVFALLRTLFVRHHNCKIDAIMGGGRL
jgi:hypothetical protein